MTSAQSPPAWPEPERPSPAGAPAAPPDEARGPVRLSIGLLLRQCQGDPAFAAHLVKLFQANSPTYQQDVRKALTEGNSDRLAKTAHRLKSALATLGDISLAPAVRELEMAARRGERERWAALLEQADGQVQDLLRQMGLLLPQLEEDGPDPAAPPD